MRLVLYNDFVVIIQTTVQTKEKAREIGKGLLEARLIACYNLLPVESVYWWKGKIEESHEVLLLLKTRDEHFAKIEVFIKEHSGYEVPEVIALHPEKVHLPYLTWVEDETV